MKNLLIILLIVPLTAITSIAQILSNGTGGGTWNSTSTWIGGIIPVTEDVIIQASDNVTVGTTQSCEDLTINSGATLTVQTGSNLSTSNTLKILGTLTMADGVINAGNGTSDYFHNSGGTFNFSGGIINASGRFKQNLTGAVSNLSGSGTINVSTSGQQTASTINNFSVTGDNTFSVSNGSTVQIIIKNGNTTGNEVINYSPQTSTFNGGSFVMENGTGLSDIYMDSDEPIYKIESKVGTGNTFHFNPDCNFSLTDLTVTSGDVQIDVGAMINITGNATLGGSNGLVVQSTGAGNGSLIASGTVVGSATVQRYIEGYSGAADGWHNISSPVNNMTISGSDFEPGSTDDLYAWGESSNLWLNFKVEANNITHFTNGQGYLAAYENTATKNFIGVLNIADITFSNLSVGSGGGWHLLGNPYSSALQWNTGSWTLNQIGGVAKIWDEIAGNYADISANGYIPSTNGFFVQAENATNEITIPAAARVHNATNNYKNANSGELPETLKLIVSNDENSFYDVTTIGFSHDAETTFDWALDSHKLFGQSTAPQLWTVIDGEEFSTNNLPYVYESYQLPLHFRAGATTMHHLVIEGIESFYLNSEIYLEDLFLNEIIDLREQQVYDFTATVGDDENRFVLHFYGVTSTEEKTELVETSVYANQNTIYIKSNQLPKDNYRVEVFNVMGQIVISRNIEPSTLSSIKLSEKAGIYIVRVHTENGIVVQKVLIK
ncbi:MAG: T9SS type A sorting domain-containing protein [Bacteroidetes bacterium]|nr:T9SS type A sorting domain-containing protein [Bacteroidota bacterium]